MTAAIELVRKITTELESRLASRVGYVESAHKDEVLKGAHLAARIIEEELTRLLDRRIC